MSSSALEHQKPARSRQAWNHLLIGCQQPTSRYIASRGEEEEREREILWFENSSISRWKDKNVIDCVGEDDDHGEGETLEQGRRVIRVWNRWSRFSSRSLICFSSTSSSLFAVSLSHIWWFSYCESWFTRTRSIWSEKHLVRFLVLV